MAFWFFKNKRPRLADLSDADKAELLFQTAKGIDLGLQTKAREFIESRNGVPVSHLKDFKDYLACGSGKVWATHRACDLTANVLVGAEMQVLKGTGDKAKPLDLSAEPARFLVSPNPFDSWEELIRLTTFHLKLCGKAYWLKDGVNVRGQPEHLYPLLPQFVEPVPDAVKRIGSYNYKVNGKTISFEPEEIIEFRRPSPSDLIRGLGDIEAGVDLYQAWIQRAGVEEKFLANGAQPSGILSRKAGEDGTPGIQDDDEWEAFQKKWQAKYGGVKNAGKTAFLNGAWEYHRLGLTMAEMQSIEKERWTVEEIFLNHGVPLSVAGLDSSANYATAKSDEINFRKYTCVPLLNLVIGKLNSRSGLVYAYGNDIRFDYQMSGLIDVEQTMKDYMPIFEAGGMTLNELRAQAGLQRLENPLLDQHYIKTSLVPLEMSGMSQQADDDEVNEAVSGVDSGKRQRRVGPFREQVRGFDSTL